MSRSDICDHCDLTRRAQLFEIGGEAVGVVSEYISIGKLVTADPNFEA